eukprot:CAMPEP_0183581338 /NCGR_PEP_ID=MMETSP0371-20130417/147436_1 /TAXON_ID=268820 /ORGANISM="Peridinium aciculiferum, Strain PAER-2" /LENGTH=208 /DNA_ID=CAMNT_0025792005 /DNA_START=14 /DNA_END=640 /DNA_ORIENTATION=-
MTLIIKVADYQTARPTAPDCPQGRLRSDLPPSREAPGMSPGRHEARGPRMIGSVLSCTSVRGTWASERKTNELNVVGNLPSACPRATRIGGAAEWLARRLRQARLLGDGRLRLRDGRLRIDVERRMHLRLLDGHVARELPDRGSRHLGVWEMTELALSPVQASSSAAEELAGGAPADVVVLGPHGDQPTAVVRQLQIHLCRLARGGAA